MRPEAHWLGPIEMGFYDFNDQIDVMAGFTDRRTGPLAARDARVEMA